MKILILPDWMTIGSMYKEVADSIGAQIYNYRAETLENRVKEVKAFLKQNKQDIVIGFGLGATIAMEAATTETIIPVNPILKGSILKLSNRFDKDGFEAMRLCDLSSKLILKFLVDKWKNIPQSLVHLFRTCNVDKEIALLEQMKNVSLTGRLDKKVKCIILSKSEKFCDAQVAKDFAQDNVFIYKEVKGGHLVALDNPTGLSEILKEVIE